MKKKIFISLAMLITLISISAFGHDKDVPVVRSSEPTVTETVDEETTNSADS
ncbi:MAG: hypothetical protein JEZ08_22405 [Clostridiales bacterium]|nr:hypothetical protein [Clostridiales bacterium]